MVAVLTVFACHLWGWPSGGFVGVDVFFVISGFLITGNLLRTAETTGTVSFRGFYWNRVRRIVPAATVVLVLTYLASVVVFLPFRSQQVAVDAAFAFAFLSNWWFGYQGTDYFRVAADTVSPIQHYWSLSIEEQFYFVWPALIFLISVVVIRKAWTHTHRMQLAGGVMGVIVAASLGWAIWETSTSPTWAYFNTFSRVWELGVGALLATAVGLLAKIPTAVKPILSWAGLALIAASLFLITDESVGFPAPWGLLPVAGAALVIAAGVGGEPKHQPFLRNPVSEYIGNISYSLYLVHWPSIILLAAIMDPGWRYTTVVLAASFGLAVASYHFVEQPLRRADWTQLRGFTNSVQRGRYHPGRSAGYAAIAAGGLMVVALTAFTMRPIKPPTTPPVLAAPMVDMVETGPQLGPLAAALQGEITGALKAAEWPQFDPSMEMTVTGPITNLEVTGCAQADQTHSDEDCTWGSPTAPTRIVLVGDSIAMSYGGPLRDIALNSGGQIQLHLEVTAGCQFSAEQLANNDEAVVAACPAKKQEAVDYINATKPSVVIISDTYTGKKVAGSEDALTSSEWYDSMYQMVDKFRASTDKVVLLSAPPADKAIAECYGKRSSVPADCVSTVQDEWHKIAKAERDIAEAVDGAWIDSRLWLCNDQGLCPAFVGSTPTKRDRTHLSNAYGEKITPVIAEAFRDAGVF